MITIRFQKLRGRIVSNYFYLTLTHTWYTAIHQINLKIHFLSWIHACSLNIWSIFTEMYSIFREQYYSNCDCIVVLMRLNRGVKTNAAVWSAFIFVFARSCERSLNYDDTFVVRGGLIHDSWLANSCSQFTPVNYSLARGSENTHGVCSSSHLRSSSSNETCRPHVRSPSITSNERYSERVDFLAHAWNVFPSATMKQLSTRFAVCSVVCNWWPIDAIICTHLKSHAMMC